MFERPHHRAIATILAALDADFLLKTESWFAGGTAIVLQLGEYRESRDIDFLCASSTGYRLLREATFGGGFDRLFGKASGVSGVTVLREVRADQYGLRTQLEAAGTVIRFEIVREARVELAGSLDPQLGVPVLSRADMYCEKLLANADRFADRATLSRDIMDLSMMILHWGPIPDVAWSKAEAAYGSAARNAFARAVSMIRSVEWLEHCAKEMSISPDIASEILSAHGGPLDPD